MGSESSETALEERLSRDITAVNMEISLVAAALLSYRHDTVLRPFPPMLINSANDKDYRALDKLLLSLHLKKANLSNLTNEHKDFLSWLLNPDNGPTLASTPPSTFQKIKELTGHLAPIPEPNYIFEVRYTEESDMKFREIQGSNQLLYAYHGSKIENFHSILNFGLNAHMSKNALFGEGTYLTSELSVAMTFCPTGQAWKNSQLGHRLGCVAVCELIDHPSVKCQQKHQQVNGQVRSHIRGSEGGQIPEKYYVVQNNELLRVKYLLVYAEKYKSTFRNTWFYEHRFALLMASYLLLLLSVAVLANKDFTRNLKRLWK